MLTSLALLVLAAAGGAAQASTMIVNSTPGGSAAKSVPDSLVYTPNSLITLTATPAFSPSTFVGWRGDTANNLGGPLAVNPLLQRLSTNKTDRKYTAVFSHRTAVTATTKGGGSLAVTPNHPFYSPDSLITITATPAPGFTFLGWSGDTTGSMNPLVIHVTEGNMYFLAEFTPTVPGVGTYGLLALCLLALSAGGWVLWRRRRQLLA